MYIMNIARVNGFDEIDRKRSRGKEEAAVFFRTTEKKPDAGMSSLSK